MRFRHVCLERIAYTLPDEIVSSAELEQRLSPLYQRLRLPEGRLEAITGVRQRRFWPPGTLPSQISIQTGSELLNGADIDRSQIGVLIHASVCRDHLEPATACAVHHGLRLTADCMAFDLSNACLGLLSGMIQIACMIELGIIRAGIVVGTEGSRQLVETTIDTLNRNLDINRRDIKSAIASLTIGSGSCAMLLVHHELSQSGHPLLGGSVQANTGFHQLCHSGADEAVASGMQPLMETDAETLMHQGIATAARTFDQFLQHLVWTRNDIHKSICHQVGTAHQKMLFETLNLSPSIDFSTLDWLGNTGSVALPITLAIGLEQGHLKPDDNLILMGIGSGINCVMLGCRW